MTVRFACKNCGRMLAAGGRFAGARAHCPACGNLVEVPSWAHSPDSAAAEAASTGAGGPAYRKRASVEAEEDVVDAEIVTEPVVEFLDPPAPAKKPAGGREPELSVVRRMFEAMLDPRSIQWMLVVGGALAVLGLIVWVVSLGIFENRILVAVALGVGTLLVLGAGCFVSLATRYKTAGNALAFLGCVVMPLNLWYYHAQDLVRLEDHLWVGGVACCLLYALMVRVLRSPLFMYAVEAGITLTVLLFLADLSLPFDSSLIAIGFMVLGLMSIHAERAFSPGDGEFCRDRFGLPLFWSGHVQVAVSLAAVVVLQAGEFLGDANAGDKLLAAGIWLAAAYVYLYSDLVVRRVGVYVYLAALALLASLLTFVAGYLTMEAAIVVLAITALIANAIEHRVVVEQRFSRVVAPLGIFLGGFPLLLGWLLHLRATSRLAAEIGWQEETGSWFVGAMLTVAVATRVSAWLYRERAPRRTVVYLFCSAAALIIAAAGTLRMMHVEEWSRQAPILMVIPIAYLLAARLWRGKLEERALSWVARAGAAVILIHGLMSVINVKAMLIPIEGETRNLLLGVVFVEAAVFYALLALFRRASVGGYLSAASACAALWQFLGYLEVPHYLHTLLFAVLGIGILGLARALKIEQVKIYGPGGGQGLVTRGRGRGAFQVGNAILSVAFIAAFLQGIGRLASSGDDWRQLFALCLTTAVSCAAVGVVPGGAWRRAYVAYSVALAALVFLTLNIYVDLSGWQKLEIFCAVGGIAMVAGGY
ncbi:MAG: hypothetical protein FJ276_07480, partial [Planctomycetes bacterium]|nr:hypothetical protein [Planctomycetota bacterium]